MSSSDSRFQDYTRGFYVALAVRTAVALGWLATLWWLVRLDERAFLRQPRLSLTRRAGLPWAPSYRLKLALWQLLHGRVRQAVRANPLVFVVAYLATDLTWHTGRALARLAAPASAPAVRAAAGLTAGRHA